MKFSVASVLALATAAIAAPTTAGHHTGQCGHVVCVDSSLLVVDLDVDVLGLIDIDLDILLGHTRKCYKSYCCPTRCEAGKRIPDSCTPRR